MSEPLCLCSNMQARADSAAGEGAVRRAVISDDHSTVARLHFFSERFGGPRLSACSKTQLYILCYVIFFFRQCWTFAFEYCRLYPASMTDKEQLCDLHDDNDDFKETKWPRDVCRAPCNKASSKRPYKFPTFRPSPSRFDRALRHGANDGEQT